jgi:hypothetical protein
VVKLLAQTPSGGSTFAAPVVIEGATTDAALRITQTGTGNALLVEDSTNPDSTPFVIDASGRLGVGTTAPNQQVDILSTGLGLGVARFTTSTGTGAGIEIRKSASATVGTNTILANGETIGRVIFSGADGTSYPLASEIRVEVDGTPGTNDMPGRLIFSTTADGASSPTERMRITSAGNVGIGTSSPSYRLQVGDGSADTRALFLSNNNFSVGVGRTSGALGGWIGSPSGDVMVFSGSGGNEKMRIDSSGNVGIGTSSPSALLNLYSATVASALVQGDAATNFAAQRNSTDASSANIVIRKARGTTASPTAVASGDTLGGILFQAYGGTNTRNIGAVQAFVDTYTSDTNISSYLTFSNSAAGSAGNTERMRLDASGNLGLGVTPSAWSSQFKVLEGGDSDNQQYVAFQTNGNDLKIGTNNWYNGTNFIYKFTGTATRYDVSRDSFAWHTAPSGTAGNAITFTQAMTLDASGNLGIGTTSPSRRLEVSTTGTTPAFHTYNGGNSAAITSYAALAGLSLIAYQSDAGSPFTKTSAIVANSDGTVPSVMQFWTKTSGDSSPTERMRIDSSGNVLFAKAVRATITTDNDLSFDMNAASNFKSTLSAGGALTFTNITSGQTGNIILVNGANYAITAAATTKVSATCLATISATGTYWLSYYSDGTNVFVANTGALA